MSRTLDVYELAERAGCLGKFIARVGDEVIACGDSVDEVLDAVRRAGLNPKSVLLDYVPLKPIYWVL